MAPDLYTGGNESSSEHFLKFRQHILMNVLRHVVLLDNHLLVCRIQLLSDFVRVLNTADMFAIQKMLRELIPQG